MTWVIRDSQGWSIQVMDTKRDAETLLISHGYQKSTKGENDWNNPAASIGHEIFMHLVEQES